MSLPLPEQIQFESAADAVEFFRKARNYFNPDIIAKQWVNSIFWSRWTTAPWPINTTTQQTAFRLPRGYYDDSLPWDAIDTDCGDDGCGGNLNVINMTGSESYNFSLLAKDFTTPKFCIDKWIFDLFPSIQIEQFMQFLAGIQQREIQNLMRANVFGQAGKHWLATATDGSAYCGEFDQDGWYIPQTAAGGYDFRYVYVNKDPADFNDIALPSYDVFEDVYQWLAREDSAFRSDILGAAGGARLLDIVVPDARTSRAIMLEGKDSTGNWNSVAGFNDANTQLRLGIRRVVGDYMFSYDDTAFRYNYDSVYNATVSYSAADPDTWPRLVRVPDYLKAPVSGSNGCKGIVNPAYMQADFGISMPWPENDVVKLWTSPNPSIAGLPTSTPNFMGDWDMVHLPWSENNRFQNIVLWQARFRDAVQIQDPTLLQPILHRLDNRKVANGACCAIKTNYVAPTDEDCYNCDTNPVVLS